MRKIKYIVVDLGNKSIRIERYGYGTTEKENKFFEHFPEEKDNRYRKYYIDVVDIVGETSRYFDIKEVSYD